MLCVGVWRVVCVLDLSTVFSHLLIVISLYVLCRAPLAAPTPTQQIKKFSLALRTWSWRTKVYTKVGGVPVIVLSKNVTN